jgi:hypothetical protein
MLRGCPIRDFLQLRRALSMALPLPPTVALTITGRGGRSLLGVRRGQQSVIHEVTNGQDARFALNASPIVDSRPEPITP